MVDVETSSSKSAWGLEIKFVENYFENYGTSEGAVLEGLSKSPPNFFLFYLIVDKKVFENASTTCLE